MFTLLIIVMLAVCAVWLSNADRKHRVALLMIGLMSVVVGGRTAALLSDSYSDEYLGVVYADDVTPRTESPSPESIEVDNPDIDGTALVGSDVQPRELAVEPTPSFRYLTTPRPDWVETAAIKGDDDSYQIAIESGLHVRKRTAQQSLQEEVRTAIDAYVNDYLNSQLGSRLSGYSIEEGKSGELRTINLRIDGKSFEIARERFDEQVEFDYGVMNQSHALVKIDKSIQNALDARWSKVRATSRLFQTGLGAGAILLLLWTMFSYLRLDTATRGYYTGRLQFAAAAAILAIIAAGVIFANRIPWM